MKDTDQPKSTRSAKNTRRLTDLGLRRLNVKKHLHAVNAERRDQHREDGRPMKEFKETVQDLIWDGGQRGLSVLVSAGGTKTYRSTFKLNGQWLTRTIGRVGEMVPNADPDKEDADIKEARRITENDRALAKRGVDPRLAATAEAEPDKQTYEYVVDQFIEHYAKAKQRTWGETERVLKGTCSAWLKKNINDITKADARTLLRSFVAEGHVYKASVTQAWLKKLWRWAYKEDLVAIPIMEAVSIEFVKRVRDRIYDAEEIKAIWNAANKLEPADSAYVKLLILLAPRKTALACLRRSHLNDPDNPTVWTTPFELTKSKKSAVKKRTYLTPLPPLAQRIIMELTKDQGDSDLLFPSLSVRLTKEGQHSVYVKRLVHGLIEHGAPKDFKPHTMRHTLATWLENQGHSEWERGLALNHSGSVSVTAGYSHGYPSDLKRSLLEEWADHVKELVRPAEGRDAAALTRHMGS